RNVVERRRPNYFGRLRRGEFQVNLSHGVMSQDASCWLTLFAGIALTGLVTFLCDFLAEPTVATQVCAVVMTIALCVSHGDQAPRRDNGAGAAHIPIWMGALSPRSQQRARPFQRLDWADHNSKSRFC